MRTYLFTLLILFFSFFSTAQNKVPAYKIDIHFDPDSNYLHCLTEIQYPGDSIFLLTNGLTIESVKADNKKVKFHQSKSEVASHSVKISVNTIPEKIQIEYSGRINPDNYPKTISLINQVNKNLIELSNHLDWYPRLPGWHGFTYTMKVNVPERFGVVTNGKLVAENKIAGKRYTSEWKSEGLSYGITMLSAPGLKKSVADNGKYTLEVYSSHMPESYIDSMKNALMQSVQLLDSLFGSLENHSLIRLVYSPRSAGGYARRPLIVVSEAYALEQRTQPMGFARDFRLNSHEIAHYWSKASTNTPDDWINEGLAEYAALWVSEKVIGKEFADLLVKEYNGIIQGTPTYTAIVETNEGSIEREINRYYKPTILLNNLREKYGERKMHEFLNHLFLRFNETNAATTSIFLHVLKESAGSEAEQFFREALYRNGWNDKTEAVGKLLTEKNSMFIGKWSGLLTQFGSSTRFILNLNVQDGKIIPNLDSPDQNVFGLQASELLLDGDSICFKVGIASAVYMGHLNPERNLIVGKWNQRNIDYPLNVKKEE